jgi:hypothetical protein
VAAVSTGTATLPNHSLRIILKRLEEDAVISDNVILYWDECKSLTLYKLLFDVDETGEPKYVDETITAVAENERNLSFLVTVGGETIDKGAKLSRRNVQTFTIETIMNNFFTGGLEKNSTCTVWLQFVARPQLATKTWKPEI